MANNKCLFNLCWYWGNEMVRKAFFVREKQMNYSRTHRIEEKHANISKVKFWWLTKCEFHKQKRFTKEYFAQFADHQNSHAACYVHRIHGKLRCIRNEKGPQITRASECMYRYVRVCVMMFYLLVLFITILFCFQLLLYTYILVCTAAIHTVCMQVPNNSTIQS